jgi:hypothetical protein
MIFKSNFDTLQTSSRFGLTGLAKYNVEELNKMADICIYQMTTPSVSERWIA